MTVRPAAPKDAQRIVETHLRSWRVTYTGRIPQDLIDDFERTIEQRVEATRAEVTSPAERSGFLVVEVAGALAGFARFGPLRPEVLGDPPSPAVELAAAGEVYSIYLGPPHIGRGHGRALLDAALDGLRERDFEEAFVRVLGTNARALSFYEGLGFARLAGMRNVTLDGHELAHLLLRRTLG